MTTRIFNPIPEKLETETLSQYHMLQEWIYLGLGRNVKELADKFGCTRKHIYALIKRFNWKDRTATYDIEMARERYDENLARNARFKQHELEIVETIYESLLKLGSRLCMDMMTIAKTPSMHHAEEALIEDQRLSRQLLTLHRYTRLLEKYRKLLGIAEPGLLEQLPILNSPFGAGSVATATATSSHSQHESSSVNANRGRINTPQTPQSTQELLDQIEDDYLDNDDQTLESLTSEIHDFITEVGDMGYISPEVMSDSLKHTANIQDQISILRKQLPPQS